MDHDRSHVRAVLLDRRTAIRQLIGGAAALGAAASAGAVPPISAAEDSQSSPIILDAALFEPYVKYFNAMVAEEIVNYIPNSESWRWMQANIPYFTCPDKNVEETYYYRWWAYRKHIEKTPKGFVITEFLKPVNHATEYNAISCAYGHHVAEGRWLHEKQYLDSYTSFWLESGEEGGLQPRFHQFSGWASFAVYDRWLVNADKKFLFSLVNALVLDYRTWESERQLPSGLFWQRDVSDGMEESASGGRKVRNIRPTINSYMYGNAKALAAIGEMAPDRLSGSEYSSKAATLKRLVQDRLWNKSAGFFETVLEGGTSANVREEIGFTPWYFDLPEDGKGYEEAWKQLLNPEGFYAPYGPTTTERRDSRFRVAYSGDDCQWNGPSWPFATTITLRALENVLNNYHQHSVSREDYFRSFLTYTRSHLLSLPDGRRIPWVDEDLNPFTGEWLARQRKIDKGTFYGRGDHYNHSTYADHVITGVAGLRPRADGTIEVNPLLPENTWDWFCLDNILYHRQLVTILWDKTGRKFGKGQGLRVFVNGSQVAQRDQLAPIRASLTAAG